MQFVRNIANQTVRLKADEAYEVEANQVLDFVTDSVDEINEKTVVSFHYAFVAFKPIDDFYQIVTPKLDGDAIEEFTEDVTYFLSIIRATFSLAKRLNLRGQLSNFHYKNQVIVANNAFTQTECYAHRYDDQTWFIGPVDQRVPSQPLQQYAAYEVFAQHPEFYEVIHLPKDYIALYSNRALISVLNLEGKDILAN